MLPSFQVDARNSLIHLNKMLVAEDAFKADYINMPVNTMRIFLLFILPVVFRILLIVMILAKYYIYLKRVVCMK